MSSFDTSHMNSELLLRCNSVHILYSIAFCHFNLVFLTAGDAVRPRAQRHCHACKTPRSMYPSIYNSCPNYSNHKLLQKNIFTYPGLHYLFALGAPRWQSRMKRCMNEKTIPCLANPRTMYPSIFNSFPVIRTASAKINVFTYRSQHFCFPWRCPCDYHALCCTDGKTIQCLPNPSQHVPIYLQ